MSTPRELTIDFGPPGQLTLRPAAADTPEPAAARQWLDEQFTAFDCEPLRPSGKVLIADKLLALAASAGRGPFDGDPAWAGAFAAAALAALGRPAAHIDLPAMAVRG